MGYWDRKKVLVTGGGGFIGSHVVERLLASGKSVRVTVADRPGPTKKRNLSAVWKHIRFVGAELSDPKAALRLCRGQDVVLNLAASVGGVGWNSVHPGSLFRDNVAIGVNVLEAARRAGVGRFLVVSSACVYPRDCAIPTPESEGTRAAPEKTRRGLRLGQARMAGVPRPGLRVGVRHGGRDQGASRTMRTGRATTSTPSART